MKSNFFFAYAKAGFARTLWFFLGAIFGATVVQAVEAPRQIQEWLALIAFIAIAALVTIGLAKINESQIIGIGIIGVSALAAWGLWSFYFDSHPGSWNYMSSWALLLALVTLVWGGVTLSIQSPPARSG